MRHFIKSSKESIWEEKVNEKVYIFVQVFIKVYKIDVD